MTTVFGIDPGKKGGLAWARDDGTYFAAKMPETEHEIHAWFTSWWGSSTDFTVIEKVHSMPGQGVKSMFTFGQGYGFLRACLVAHAMPFEAVPAGTWQRKMGCLTRGDKNVSKRRAQELYPATKWTHATADAILIATYALWTHAERRGSTVQ